MYHSRRVPVGRIIPEKSKRKPPLLKHTNIKTPTIRSFSLTPLNQLLAIQQRRVVRDCWVPTGEALLYIHWQSDVRNTTDEVFLSAGFLLFDLNFSEGCVFVRAFEDYLGVGEEGGGGVLAADFEEGLVGGDELELWLGRLTGEAL